MCEQKDEIKILECDVQTKDRLLEENCLKVEDLDKEVAQIDQNQKHLFVERTELEYEAIKMKKQS